MPDDSEELGKVMGNTTQIHYDRLYDRIFDNSKLLLVAGNIEFISMKDGLTECLTEFVRNPKWQANCGNRIEVYLDKKTGEKAALSELSDKGKLKYLGWYYVPRAMKLLKKIKGN